MPPRHPLMIRLLDRQSELFRQVNWSLPRESRSLSVWRCTISRKSTVWRSPTQPRTLSTCPSFFVRTPRLKHRINGRATNTFYSLPRVRIARRFNSSKADSSQSESHSLSQRLRQLSREYGWSALGVYLLLSALDFPFCFAAVRLLGVERIGHYEHVVIEAVKGAVRTVWPFSGVKEPHAKDDKEIERHTIDHGITEAEIRNTGEGASTRIPALIAACILKALSSMLHCADLVPF